MRRFKIHTVSLLTGALATLSLATGNVHAQAPVTNQTRRALDFYGGQSALNTLSEMPCRTPIQPATSGQLPHSGKPFQSASSGPTISPYLNLFRDERESSEALPSYFSFVRPQMQQQAANEQQQREIAQLQRQLQSGPQHRAASVPGSGTPARFMDTAQFYGGWRR
jgi:hypothetical protein